MRALVIDDEAKAKASRVLAYAEDHHYRPGPGQPVPGDNPNFVAKFGTYRVVFTYTHADDLVWRHMSVSVPSYRKFANPVTVFTIAAELFGFTGYDVTKHSTEKVPDGWLIDVNPDDHCVVLAQPIGSDVEKVAMN